MPEGTPQRSSVPPDLLHLLKLMSIRSELVEMRSASSIEEIPTAGASLLDSWVQSRVRTEQSAVGTEADTEPVVTELDEPSPIESELAIEEPEELLASSSPDIDEPSVIEPAEDEVERIVEADELLESDLGLSGHAAIVERDEPADEADEPAQIAEGDQLPSAIAEDEADTGAAADEGQLEASGADFQALLAGAREEEVSLLPADGEVTLRAIDGPQPGAEFTGRSTLAGATGVYCLIEHFDLPVDTRVKVTLTAPRLDQIEIEEAKVTRVRKAPGDTTEVQLGFDTRHEDFEEFVARHFGEKPGRFSLFGRRRKP